jgi:hypothetical protein
MNDPEVTRGLGRGGPYTREMEEDWFERASTSKTGVHFTIYELEALRPIGTVGLDSIDPYHASATMDAIPEEFTSPVLKALLTAEQGSRRSGHSLPSYALHSPPCSTTVR